MKNLEMPNFILLLAVILVCCVLLSGCTSVKDTTEAPLPANTPIPVPITTPMPTPEPLPSAEPAYLPKSWTLSFAGDCTIGTLHEWQNIAVPNNMLYAIGDDYALPFSNVRSIFENDDLTLVNFEGTLTERTQPVGKDYRFRASPEYAAVLNAGSVEAVSLANNHAGDYRAEGTADTQAALDAAGILWGDGETPIITELSDGLTLGIVPCNVVEIDLAVGDVDSYMSRLTPIYELCRVQGCEIVIAFVHWGWEYRYTPESWMVDFAHRLAELGCDMVVGSHAHVLQPMELWNDVPIFYSLGNFCFGGHSNPTDKDCIIVQQQIVSAEEDSYTLGETTVIPCRISSTDSTNDFRPTPYSPDSSDYLRVMEKLDASLIR